MRLISKVHGIGVGLVTSLLGGAAFAQSLEVIGQPLAKGTSFQPAATELAEGIHKLDDMLLYIIAAITIFVTLLLIYVMFRFNTKSNPTPAKFTHNSPLEVAWTLIPVVILIFIGSFSLPELFKQQDFSKVKADVVIKATGNQWYWSYEYIDQDVAFDSYMIGSPATGGSNMMTPEVEKQLLDAGYTKQEFLLATDTAVVIPVGKVILMQVTATDVIHAWKIPAFGSMQDAVPGRIAQTWFKADKEGIYFGQCSELCGQMHAFMPITVKVVSEAAYATWLEGAKAGNVNLASN
jgi:cytochrome c oxidase subunit 2